MGIRRQRGATLAEFAVILPTLLVCVLAVWQAALVFHAKSHLNYAAFEAARAGSVDHARLASIVQGLAKGLVAYYGGGLNTVELAQRYAQVSADVATAARVEILSPTRESFDDYQSPVLRTRLNVDARVIPNLGIAYASCPYDRSGCASDPQNNRSGQSLSDANLLKLRITYGVPPGKQLPLVGRFYTWALNALGAGAGDVFKQGLLDSGRIPLVAHVTVRMHSEPIENSTMVSNPGAGNNGNPRDPAETPPEEPPPGGGEDPPVCPG
ncbi:MAG: TadE/TadG family type IV pilus assembly protein [Pseudomonadota bacterium]